jgi:hypothetical protein
MKYIKKFNEQEKSIEDWCEKFCPIKYIINSDNTVDTNAPVNISHKNIDIIPIQFRYVTGHFVCCNNNLITLKGCPEKVSYFFSCSDNKLKTLEGGPKEVNDFYSCKRNELTTLEGAPKKVGGYFNCSDNKLKTLEGGPKEVNGFYSCEANNLITLDGCANKIDGLFYCIDNPIFAVYVLFLTYERYKTSLDYKYLRGDKIYKKRLEKACIEANVDVPDSIPGYEYID